MACMIRYRWRHPRRARAEARRREAERRAAHAAYKAYVDALPEFDGPPPGFDPVAFGEQIMSGGGQASTMLDTTLAPDGRYVIRVPLRDQYGLVANWTQRITIANGAPRPDGP